MNLLFAALIATSLCTPGPKQSPREPEVTFSILQLNDVYEITPTSGEGGMARVATVFQQLKQREPNSFIVIAGDFFSPSALGTAKVDGERLAGKQMVATLNMLPVTIATFGNHEFDPSYELFQKRMAESKFTYVSSNVLDAQRKPFPGVRESYVQTVSTSSGDVRIGFLGLTIPSNPKDYVTYADVMDSAKKQVEALRPNVDVLIAITHLAYEDDMKIAKTLPQIDMIIGGHEHERHRIEIGSLPGIYKADANARTVFIHDFAFTPSTHRLRTTSTLKEVTSEIPEDPAVKAEVEKWVKVAYDGFRKEGFEPTNKVAEIREPLDGKEESVRNHGTRLTQLIAEGMIAAAPGTEVAIFNGGSIRIDDVIPPGPLTEYDVIRILPFGGPIWSVDMKGELLKRILDRGLANRGNGGYLQTANVTIGADGGWQINGKALDVAGKYRVAINDFLLTGNEQNLSFLKRDNPDITIIAEHGDIRATTIAQLKKG